MKALLTGGFWGTSHWFLDSIGRGVVWLVHLRVPPHDDEVYSMMGGGSIGAILASWFGYIVSRQSQALSPFAFAILGVMVGACTGVFCGAIVQIIDEYIDALTDSFNLPGH
jgi:ABC-type Fe3+-siderophore transport system permease subunit